MDCDEQYESDVEKVEKDVFDGIDVNKYSSSKNDSRVVDISRNEKDITDKVKLIE